MQIIETITPTGYKKITINCTPNDVQSNVALKKYFLEKGISSRAEALEKGALTQKDLEIPFQFYWSDKGLGLGYRVYEIDSPTLWEIHSVELITVVIN
jgi:hypothetical protein